MTMELRDIEYFTVLAEQGSIGRAADILRLSQPAISKSLRRLEDALRVSLFRRSHRGLELTAEGSVLLARTRDLRLSLQNVARELTELGEGRVTHLRIGVGPSVPGELVTAVASDLLVYASRSVVCLGKAAGYPLTILSVAELAWRRPIGAIVRREGYLPPAVQR